MDEFDQWVTLEGNEVSIVEVNVSELLLELVQGVEKRRNGSCGTNRCLVWRPVPVFAMGHVRQRNGMKPYQTLVLDLK